MKILEEFWYGNIEPTMTDEQKALFEKYTDCVREHQTITEYLILTILIIVLLILFLSYPFGQDGNEPYSIIILLSNYCCILRTSAI